MSLSLLYSSEIATGETVYARHVRDNFQQVFNLLNGNLVNANIDVNAAIDESKIDLSFDSGGTSGNHSAQHEIGASDEIADLGQHGSRHAADGEDPVPGLTATEADVLNRASYPQLPVILESDFRLSITNPSSNLVYVDSGQELFLHFKKRTTEGDYIETSNSQTEMLRCQERVRAKPTDTPDASATGSGSFSASTGYGYKITFVKTSESAPDRESDSSESVSVGSFSGKAHVELTNIPQPTDSSDKIYIYRTTDGGSTYYKLDEINVGGATSYTDSAPDTNLDQESVAPSELVFYTESPLGTGWEDMLNDTSSDNMLAARLVTDGVGSVDITTMRNTDDPLFFSEEIPDVNSHDIPIDYGITPVIEAFLAIDDGVDDGYREAMSIVPISSSSLPIEKNTLSPGGGVTAVTLHNREQISYESPSGDPGMEHIFKIVPQLHNTLYENEGV